MRSLTQVKYYLFRFKVLRICNSILMYKKENIAFTKSIKPIFNLELKIDSSYKFIFIRVDISHVCETWIRMSCASLNIFICYFVLYQIYFLFDDYRKITTTTFTHNIFNEFNRFSLSPQFQTTIKIFTACLRLDIEYKTLGIQWDTTSKEVVSQLLRRYVFMRTQ